MGCDTSSTERDHTLTLIFSFAGSFIECQTWRIQRPQSLLHAGNGCGARWQIRTSGCCWQGSVLFSLLFTELRLLRERQQCQHRGPGALWAAEPELFWGRGQPPECRLPACWATWDASASVWQWGKQECFWRWQAGGGLCHNVQFLSD